MYTHTHTHMHTCGYTLKDHVTGDDSHDGATLLVALGWIQQIQSLYIKSTNSKKFNRIKNMVANLKNGWAADRKRKTER